MSANVIRLNIADFAALNKSDMVREFFHAVTGKIVSRRAVEYYVGMMAMHNINGIKAAERLAASIPGLIVRRTPFYNPAASEENMMSNNVDLGFLLRFEDEEFVHNAYKLILRRDADPDGFNNYLHHLRAGMEKVVIARAIASSAEAKSKGTILVEASEQQEEAGTIVVRKIEGVETYLNDIEEENAHRIGLLASEPDVVLISALRTSDYGLVLGPDVVFNASASPDGQVTLNEGWILFGPRKNLPPGKYRLYIDVSADRKSLIRYDVSAARGLRKLLEVDCYGSLSFNHAFMVTPEDTDIEIRMVALAGAGQKCTINKIYVARERT